MSERRRLGLLGGTFDPIHVGHLDALDAARAALGLNEILVVPSHSPPHRPAEPRASAYHRFALVALALADRPGCRVSDMEMSRPGRSFTSDTLRALHAQGWRPWQIFFIMGADAFADIATWKAYPEILDAAHFTVIARPGTTAETALARTPALGSRVRQASDHAGLSGPTSIILVEAPTRDVSSTLIRARLADRRPIDDLVPPTVARHILINDLYGSVGDLHDKDRLDPA